MCIEALCWNLEKPEELSPYFSILVGTITQQFLPSMRDSLRSHDISTKSDIETYPVGL